MITTSQSSLRAGAAATDITPPLEVGILMSAVNRLWAPFERVRMPLHARALVIENDKQRYALVSLELLGLAARAVGGHRRFRARVLKAAGKAVTDRNLILASTHTHTGPETLAATDLYKTAPFKRWVDHLADQIGLAIRRAADSLEPAHVDAATVEAPGLCIYRRFKTTRGIVLSSDPPPENQIISREGPTDPAVHVLRLRGADDHTIAILVNATCHAIHEMCIPQISPDYPGEMSRLLEEAYPGGTVLFFNGAAGNTNPPTASEGADRALEHGRALAGFVDKALAVAVTLDVAPIALRRKRVALPGKSIRTGKPIKTPLRTQIAALRIGQAAMVFLPGEPFVEIGLQIKAASPFVNTAVVAYAEDMIGYLPVDAAFDEGGYELGPGARARAHRGTEAVLVNAAAELLNELAAQPA